MEQFFWISKREVHDTVILSIPFTVFSVELFGAVVWSISSGVFLKEVNENSHLERSI